VSVRTRAGIAEQLTVARAFIVARPWLGFVATFAVLLVIGLIIRLIFTYRDLTQNLDSTEWLLVGALLVMVLLVVRASRFYRWWMFWNRETPGVPLGINVAYTLLTVLVMTETFAAITIFLGQAGLVATTTPDVFRPSQDVARSQRDMSLLLATFEEIYFWNLMDSVPTLKIPETLDWREAIDLNRSGGFLVLVYKVLVILPVLTLVRSIFNPKDDKSDRASLRQP
jgi:hypothetical protein